MHRLFVCALICSATVQGNVPPHEKPYYELENAEVYFKEYLDKFQKSYDTEAEYMIRFEIFVNNLIRINQINEVQKHAISDVNFMTDMTDEEINSMLGYRSSDLPAEPFPADLLEGVEIPDDFDWRTNNSVTPVKNQGNCGSCWAFSITALIESQYAIKHKKMIDLSEQQILDCDSNDFGCYGGFPFWAINFIARVGGQMLESDYPYKAVRNHKCSFLKSKVGVKVKNGTNYYRLTEEDMAKLVYTYGPISVAFFMTHQMMFYKKGVFIPDNCVGMSANHAVLIVGYGTMEGVPYWLIKNSFGKDWGDHGYFRLVRGKEDCMINTDITTVEIE